MFYLLYFKQVLLKCKQDIPKDIIYYTVVFSRERKLFPLKQKGLIDPDELKKDLDSKLVEFVDKGSAKWYRVWNLKYKKRKRSYDKAKGLKISKKLLKKRINKKNSTQKKKKY